MARTLAAYPQARGNLAVVAVVDSSQPEFPSQLESAIAAPAHFGIPFRVLDLAASPATDAPLADCRAVLVFQEHLGPRLNAAGQAAVLRAAERGTGVVSFDADLAPYGEPWLRAAGLGGLAVTARSRPVARRSSVSATAAIRSPSTGTASRASA